MFLRGIPRLMKIAGIQEELEELYFEISSIARLYRKQNGENIYMPLVQVRRQLLVKKFTSQTLLT